MRGLPPHQRLSPSIQKELTITSTSKPEKVTTTKRNQGNSLVTEPFFPNTSSEQLQPATEDKSEKLKVTSGKSEDITSEENESEDSASDENESGDITSEENEKKSFSLMVSALGVPDIWDMLLFGRYTRVQSQNIHQSGIVSMQPLQ